jgi:hypothetical protein
MRRGVSTMYAGAILVRTGRAAYWILEFISLALVSLWIDPYCHEHFTLFAHKYQSIALTINVTIIMTIVFGLMV